MKARQWHAPLTDMRFDEQFGAVLGKTNNKQKREEYQRF